MFKDAALERELMRWMRPDARNFVRANWRRFVTSGSDAAAVFEIYEQKYRPDQLRDELGRWSDEGGGAENEVRSPSAGNNSAGPRISRRVAEDCDLLKRLDRFTCRAVRTRSCWAQANFRYSQCLIGGYIPPIYH
jgi:hypothetical protein